MPHRRKRRKGFYTEAAENTEGTEKSEVTSGEKLRINTEKEGKSRSLAYPRDDTARKCG
jgi:hypothetical protein